MNLLVAVGMNEHPVVAPVRSGVHLTSKACPERSRREAKGELGFEELPGWSEQAVPRTAPFVILLYSLIVLWLVQVGHRSYKPSNRP